VLTPPSAAAQVLGVPQLEVLRKVERDVRKARSTLDKFLQDGAVMAGVDADRRAILTTLHASLNNA
jgi:hypothetical protein